MQPASMTKTAAIAPVINAWAEASAIDLIYLYIISGQALANLSTWVNVMCSSRRCQRLTVLTDNANEAASDLHHHLQQSSSGS